jgi:hypothetical protein
MDNMGKSRVGRTSCRACRIRSPNHYTCTNTDDRGPYDSGTDTDDRGPHDSGTGTDDRGPHDSGTGTDDRGPHDSGTGTDPESSPKRTGSSVLDH